jgi:hypothetical protein
MQTIPRFAGLHIKIPMAFFKEIEKNHKIYVKSQKPSWAKWAKHLSPGFQEILQMMVFGTAWHLHKNGHIKPMEQSKEPRDKYTHLQSIYFQPKNTQ